VNVPSRANLAARGRGASANVTRVVRKHGQSGLRQLLTFLGLFVIVLGMLLAWNVVQNLDDPRRRLWGELASFGLIVWLAIAVLSIAVSALIRWIVSRTEARFRWVRFIEIDPISIPQALAWAAVVMISVPVAILFRFAGFAILVGATAAVYAASWYLSARHRRVPRLALCYAALFGTIALCLFAASSREAEVENATLAPATAQVPGGEELASALRPLLFFDRDERFEPVDVGDAQMEGCLKTLLAEGCEPVAAEASLDGYEYLTVSGSALTRGERPGGPDSAYYFHVVADGERLYVDYWWYFAHNPAPVAPDLLCGPALKWLSEACAEHPADWEGITVVLVPCESEQPAAECVTGGGRELTVDEVRYAQHDKVVVYPWTTLRDTWTSPAYAPWFRGAGLRPLVFVALASHASYAAPCSADCKQIARPAFKERRDGSMHWTNNGAACGSDCLQPVPVDDNGLPTSWNAFGGRWGAQHCILFGSYCDTQRAPRAPSFQQRYRELGCTREWCVTSNRF
jgi:hypothetical protein